MARLKASPLLYLSYLNFHCFFLNVCLISKWVLRNDLHGRVDPRGHHQNCRLVQKHCLVRVNWTWWIEQSWSQYKPLNGCGSGCGLLDELVVMHWFAYKGGNSGGSIRGRDQAGKGQILYVVLVWVHFHTWKISSENFLATNSLMLDPEDYSVLAWGFGGEGDLDGALSHNLSWLHHVWNVHFVSDGDDPAAECVVGLEDVRGAVLAD